MLKISAEQLGEEESSKVGQQNMDVSERWVDVSSFCFHSMPRPECCDNQTRRLLPLFLQFLICLLVGFPEFFGYYVHIVLQINPLLWGDNHSSFLLKGYTNPLLEKLNAV